MVKTYSQIIVKIIWNKYCLYIGKKPVDRGEVDSGFRSGTIFYVILFSYLIFLYVNWTGIKTTQISWTLAFCISSIQKLRRWQSEYMSIRACIHSSQLIFLEISSVGIMDCCQVLYVSPRRWRSGLDRCPASGRLVVQIPAATHLSCKNSYIVTALLLNGRQ